LPLQKKRSNEKGKGKDAARGSTDTNAPQKEENGGQSGRPASKKRKQVMAKKKRRRTRKKKKATSCKCAYRDRDNPHRKNKVNREKKKEGVQQLWKKIGKKFQK